MLYAGLDLSRQRLDVHVMDEDGAAIEVTAVHPDTDALRMLRDCGKGLAPMDPASRCVPRRRGSRSQVSHHFTA